MLPVGFGVIGLSVGLAVGWQACHRWDAGSQVKAAEHVAVVATKQGAVNTAVATQQQAVQDRIVYQTRTLIKEVPIAITPQIDHDFRLPVGLIRVHDAAVLGRDLSQIPLAAGESDGDASAVTPSAAGTILAENAGSCRAAYATLANLQDWNRQQAANQ